MISPKYRMKELQTKLTILIGDCDFYLLLAYLSGNEERFAERTTDYFDEHKEIYEGQSEYCPNIPLNLYHTSLKLQIDFKEPLESIGSKKVYQFRVSSALKTLTDDEVLYSYAKHGINLNQVPKQDIKQLRLQLFSKLVDQLESLSSLFDKKPLVSRYGLDPNDYPLDSELSLYDLLLKYAKDALTEGEKQEIKAQNPEVMKFKEQLLSHYPSQSSRVMTELDSDWVMNRSKN